MRTLLTSLAMVIALTGAAAAQADRARPADGVFDIVFSELEKHLIRQYYTPQTAQPRAGQLDQRVRRGGPRRSLPPGLAKRNDLPPGLARQYQRNGTLPPGLAKRDLPADLSQRLPRPRFGTERVAVDNDVLLIQQSTGVILDILTDVIAGG